MSTSPLRYLTGYPEETLLQVQRLIDEGRLGEYVAAHHAGVHDKPSNKLLFEYVKDLKRRHMRKAPPIARAVYDDHLMAVDHALGVHKFSSKPHGGRLRSKSEIRIASVFQTAPESFLRMIVVHELAHLREKDHSKSFYRMCTAMEPDYHELEFYTRLYLTAQELE